MYFVTHQIKKYPEKMYLVMVNLRTNQKLLAKKEISSKPVQIETNQELRHRIRFLNHLNFKQFPSLINAMVKPNHQMMRSAPTFDFHQIDLFPHQIY